MGLAEIEHTVKPRTHRKASGIILAYAECAELTAVMGFHTVCFGVEFIIGTAEIPVLAVTYARSEVQVLREGEIRQTYLEIMSHTILKLVQKAVFHELRGLEIDPVLKRGAISQREFFVEFLLAHTVLSLERIKPCHRESKVRQCK